MMALVGALALVGMAACERGTESAPAHGPVAIEAGDECHVCGMIIQRFPGPKGGAFLRGNDRALKFCSTRDLFSYVLQPEVEGRVQAIFVHDMAVTPWGRPHDRAFIAARSAWYVAGHRLKGAMGPTLASFATASDAGEFATSQGGRVLSFDDITLELVAGLDRPAGH